jgi:hypothetical protein
MSAILVVRAATGGRVAIHDSYCGGEVATSLSDGDADGGPHPKVWTVPAIEGRLLVANVGQVGHSERAISKVGKRDASQRASVVPHGALSLQQVLEALADASAAGDRTNSYLVQTDEDTYYVGDGGWELQPGYLVMSNSSPLWVHGIAYGCQVRDLILHMAGFAPQLERGSVELRRVVESASTFIERKYHHVRGPWYGIAVVDGEVCRYDEPFHVVRGVFNEWVFGESPVIE